MKTDAKSLPNLKEAANRTKSPIQITSAKSKPSDALKSWAKGRKYCIYTYGCQANVRDSEYLRGYFENIGLTETEEGTEADITIFNTCAIRENAETKIYGELGRMKQPSQNNPDMIVGICGCMMQEEKPLNFIREHFPYVNLIFGTHNIDDIYPLMNEIIERKNRVISVKSIEGDVIENMPSKRFEKYKAFVNIMYGCDKFCTYCIVPYTRGKQRSRKVEDIVKEVEGLEDHTHLRPVGRGPALPGEDVLPVEGDFPAGGSLQKVDTPQQGGLARAGSPDDGGHIPPVHCKINVPENLMLAKGFGQVAHL